MLVLTRKLNESIIINENIIINVNKIEGDSVKISINAPKEIRIYRKEVFDAIKQNNLEAALTSQKKLTLPENMLIDLEARGTAKPCYEEFGEKMDSEKGPAKETKTLFFRKKPK